MNEGNIAVRKPSGWQENYRSAILPTQMHKITQRVNEVDVSVGLETFFGYKQLRVRRLFVLVTEVVLPKDVCIMLTFSGPKKLRHCTPRVWNSAALPGYSFGR